MPYQKQSLKSNFFNIIRISIFILSFIAISHSVTNQAIIKANNNRIYALVGDIGGTNIRYQLVDIGNEKNNKQSLELENAKYSKFYIIKDQRYKVKDYQSLQDSIKEFLQNISNQHYPCISVIAIAGPVNDKTIRLSNVPKWGQMNAKELSKTFNIKYFTLINDFESISYGLQIVGNDQLIHLNNLNSQLDKSKLQGVIGPGTGLGHSILFRNKDNNELIVLPSQTGHSDFVLLDEESLEYFNFLKNKYQTDYISLQRSFCGPSIPFIHQFYWRKLQFSQQFQPQTPQFIIQKCLQPNPSSIYKKVFNLLMKYYSSAIGNFALHHLPLGGIYLVGSLTNSIIQKIKGTDILQEWKSRHPEMSSLIDSIPIVFCTQIDLGLNGAIVLAYRQLNQNNLLQKSQKLKNESSLQGQL